MYDLFLTGASGFLGSRILEQLDPAAFKSITLLCRSEPQLPAHLTAAANVEVVGASLVQVERYADRLGPETVVLHLAAVTGKADCAEYFSVNTHATGLLVSAAEQAGIAGFVFISSIAVSFRDRQGYHYAESKEQAEQLLQNSNLHWCILRPTIILGDASPIWQRFNALARKRLIVLPGDGRTLIQPIEVNDLVRLMLDIVFAGRFSNEVLEIGGPDMLSLDEFVQRIRTATGGGRARIVHLPLGLVLGLLRTFERSFPTLLPVSSGQFASFCNNGTVTGNELVRPANGKLSGIDDMLQQLVLGEGHG